MEFRIENLDQSRVLQILSETDALFDPPLSSVVKLDEYSVKLSSKAHFALAHQAGRLAGVIAFYLNDDASQIYMPYVVVYPQFRNQHVATDLLEYVIRSNPGYATVALEVVKTNTAALNLYKKLSFEVIEDRDHTYLMRRSTR
jgi:ribosomal protein S18 acetylase RimI-like enzyme